MCASGGLMCTTSQAVHAHLTSNTCSDVVEMDDDDRHDMEVFPYDEAAKRRSVGATAAHGEEGFGTLARL